MLAINKARLSAIAIITLLFTAIAFFGSELLIAKDASIEKKQTFTEWYDVSNPADPEVSGAPRTNAPPATDPENCAIDNPSTDILCAVELEVPSPGYTFMGTHKLDNLPDDIEPTGQEARTPEN